MLVELNENNFNKEVLESEVILVSFHSPFCGACINIIPILEDISSQFKVGIVNIYENRELANKYKIPATPTLIIFKDGKVKEKAVGKRDKDLIIEKMK